MIKSYKGYTIEVIKEKCLGGWSQTYYSVYREVDGLEIICDSTEDRSRITTIMKGLKERVDEFILTKGESEDLEDFYEVE